MVHPQDLLNLGLLDMWLGAMNLNSMSIYIYMYSSLLKLPPRTAHGHSGALETRVQVEDSKWEKSVGAGWVQMKLYHNTLDPSCAEIYMFFVLSRFESSGLLCEIEPEKGCIWLYFIGPNIPVV